jgi:hypothetical protein
MFILVSIVLWRRGKQEVVKKTIYMLVCLAEQQFGSKTGALKWMMVYSRLPWWIRWLFPQEILADYIEEAVQLLKKQLNNKEFNLLEYSQEFGKPKVTTKTVKSSNESVNPPI